MNDVNKDRAIINLDELERQLREASGARAAARAAAREAAPHEDPLAELARIVEQDDHYRSMWSEGAHAQPLREPAHAPDPAGGHQQPQHAVRDDYADYSWPGLRAGAHPAAPVLTEAARREHEFRDEGDPTFEGQGHLPEHGDDFASEAPQAPRRRMMMAAATAVVVLALAGGAGVVLLRHHPVAGLAGGAPPVIQADAGPSKIQPENPGGMEVPNQDRQIYNRAPEEKGPVKIVGGAEQPVDVTQAPKADPDRSIIPPPASMVPTTTATTTTPAGADALARSRADSSVLAALAPRRVKTVSVRPDGTIIEAKAEGGAPAAAANKVASLADAAPSTAALAAAADATDAGANTGPEVAPAPVAAPAASGATPVPAPRPKLGATTPVAAPKPAPVASVDTGATAAAPATTPAKPRTQVASVQPSATAPAASAGGGFAVQLAAPASEQEAKDAAVKLQKRFAGELGSLRPAVRQAEVNGKTIWRVRVGSMAREEATALCVKIQGAGGQCFVAKN